MYYSENYQLADYKFKAKLLTPLHIGNGNFLNPNSDLLEYKGGSYLIRDEYNFTSHSNPEYIDEFINSAGNLYIPGSSIKGTIKTAYLNYWLNSNHGKKAFKTFLDEMIKIGEDRELSKKRKVKIIESGGSQGKNEFSGFKKLILEPCFGDQKKFKFWNNLIIHDSERLINIKRGIIEVERYYLNHLKTGIPTYHESIIENETFDINIKYKIAIGNDSLVDDFLKDFDGFRKKVNDFALDLIEYELNLLETDDIVTEHISNYIEFIEKLYDTINNDKNSLYLRLGSGKMLFYQIIASALYYFETKNQEWLEEVWTTYMKYLSDFENEDIELFPKTRVLTHANQLPMGWVKFERL